MVRYVYPKDHEKHGQCIIHYIGWNIKWDEPYHISDTERMAKRNTNTKGPHRPRKSRYDYYDNTFNFGLNTNNTTNNNDWIVFV